MSDVEVKNRKGYRGSCKNKYQALEVWSGKEIGRTKQPVRFLYTNPKYKITVRKLSTPTVGKPILDQLDAFWDVPNAG